MTAALAHPTTGFTVADLERLPEDDDRRYELFDGELHVVPAPSVRHQRISSRLWRLLEDYAPSGLIALEAVNVVVEESVSPIPDIVLARDPDLSAVTVPAKKVVLAVEVVSPSSRAFDRWLKHGLYSNAGIPHYWRVELAPFHIVGYRLDEEGKYVEDATADSGEVFAVTEPLVMSFDPADLLQ